MQLRFVLGRAGTGKTHLCLTEIREKLEHQGESGPPLIFLVPEQASFQMERALLANLSRPATSRAQVLSFHRLAQRVLQRVGGPPGRLLGELGRQMVLRRILLHNASQLELFTASAGQPGFVTSLASTVAELRSHRLSGADLRAQKDLAAPGQGGHPLLQFKLHDLALVLEKYDDFLDQGFSDPENLLSLTAANFQRMPGLAHAEIWIDGFSGFTPQEYYVLAALMNTGAKMTVALCLDGRQPLSHGPQPDDLFFPTHETYAKLQALARQNKVDVAPNVVLDTPTPARFRRRPELNHLEGSLYRRHMPPYLQEVSDQAVELTVAADPRHEVDLAARRIVQLCRRHGYRYRDISVMVRELAGYDDLISQTFAAYDIPFFLDRRRPLVHHPLMELIRAALDTVTAGWSDEALFRYLKTDLAPLPRRAVDQLENYVLEHGLRGKVWLQKEPWRFIRRYSLEIEPGEDETRLNSHLAARADGYRRRAVAPLLPLAETLAADELTFRQGALALYQLLTTLNVPDTLLAWSQRAQKKGDLVAADEHRQAWDQLMTLLDELVEALGDEPASGADFKDVVTAGLEGLSLALVPPGLDQVLVGSIHRTRQPDLRATFLLGVNEGRFPLVTEEDAFFDDAERTTLQAAGLELAPDSRRQLLHERYLAYIAVTRPTERLWVSYPAADAKGKGLSPSELPMWLGKIFPRLTVAQPQPGSQQPDQALTTPQLAGKLAAYLRRQKQQAKPVDPLWTALHEKLLAHGKRQTAVEPILAALKEPRPVPPLAAQLQKALYSGTLATSVSRLQYFAACPFRHFAAYTLGLQERRRHQVEAPELGTLYHAILRVYVQRLLEENRDWASLDQEEALELAAEVTDQLLPRLQNEILLGKASHRHLADQIRRTVQWAAGLLGEHARRGKFVPAALELSFGLPPAQPGEKTWPAYVLPLDENRQLKLRGQIDRVDLADGWLRIVDYKRTPRNLNLSDVYYGLHLQLPAYLLAVSQLAPAQWGKKVKPAGAFFFGVQEPSLTGTAPLEPAAALAQRRRAARMQGVMVRDPNVLRLMDQDVQGPSDLVAARLNKNGQIGKSPQIVGRETLQKLLQFTRKQLVAIGREIVGGRIEPAPYRTSSGQVPCSYCPYKPVCRFEPGQGANYRNLPPLAARDFWQGIEKEVEQ